MARKTATIEITYTKAPRGLTKKYKSVREQGLKRIAGVWHNEMLPKHFTYEAFKEYGFSKRSEKHQKRKRRNYGHTNPLEYTGKTKEAMLSKMPIPKINSKRMDLNFKGVPKYIFYSVNREPSEIENLVNQYDNIWEAQRKLAEQGKRLSLKYISQVKQGLIRGRGNKLPPMRNELVATSSKEIKKLAEINEKFSANLLNKPDKKPTKKSF